MRRVFMTCIPIAFGAVACSSASSSDASLPGYVHTLERSRFAIGMIEGSRDVAGMHEIVGSEGVFASEIVSGMVIATPNRDPSSIAAGFFAGSDEDQNAAVLAYFVGVGLPSDQVGAVQAMDGFEALISEGSPIPSQNVLVKWTDSIICRAYDGVKIIDSFAWASFDATGHSVSESVYWPELPAKTMEATMKFQNMLADSTRRAAFLSLLPSEIQGGELVVHHTPGEATSFSAAPYFDATISGVLLHFDMGGHAEVLPGSESPCQ